MLLVRLLPQTVYSNHHPPPRPTFSFSTDSLHDLTDGVFIFEAVSTEDSRNTQGYDAIVVEQWTVLDVSVGFGRDAFLFGPWRFYPLASLSEAASGQQVDLWTPLGPLLFLGTLLCPPRWERGPHFSTHTLCVPDHWVEQILLHSSERSK